MQTATCKAGSIRVDAARLWAFDPGGSKTLLGPQHHPPEDPLRQEHDHDPEQDRRDAHALPSIRGCGFPGWWVGAHLGVSSGSATIPAGPRTVIRRRDASHPGAADRPVVTAFLHPAGSHPISQQPGRPSAVLPGSVACTLRVLRCCVGGRGYG